MPVRKITDKETRWQIVQWIRGGAPLAAGISLYATMPGHNVKLLNALHTHPRRFAGELTDDFCTMLGITRRKFENVIREYHGKKPEKRAGEIKPRSAPAQKRAAARPVPPSRSFRSEWRFLSQPDCPPELKSLAADKISAWERYISAHKKLFDCGSLDECLETAFQIVDNYKENRLIHEEFEYYQKHGVILGKHQIFGHYKKFERLRGRNIVELVQLATKTLPHKIWRIENELKKNDKPHLRGSREKRLKAVQAEWAEVKRLLNMT